MDRLSDLINSINLFVQQRDWAQFHTPKNLAVSISIEANELLEHFQWVTDDCQAYNQTENEEIGEEIADVFIYLLDLCDKYGFDIIDLANNKIAKNAIKYPTDKCKGSILKYTEYL